MPPSGIPAHMRAVVLTGHSGLDKLEYREDYPVPTPAEGEVLGEVLVEVSACGMNNTDVWVRQGAYGTERDADAVSSWRGRGAGSTLRFPRIQGTDTVGYIAEAGPGVPRDRIGERVLITGASGGVGSGLVQLCRARGAIPYAVAGAGKEQAVKEIGAEAVATRGTDDFPAAVEAATGGRPIDVVAVSPRISRRNGLFH
jgi:NADPH:quinone reductase-like Zn-dependent oxidoreductase